MSIAHVHMSHHIVSGSARLPTRDLPPPVPIPGRLEDPHPLAEVYDETPKDLLWLGRLLCLVSSTVTVALVAAIFA